jgi:hypothetical protein
MNAIDFHYVGPGAAFGRAGVSRNSRQGGHIAARRPAIRAHRRFAGFDAFHGADLTADSHVQSLKRAW